MLLCLFNTNIWYYDNVNEKTQTNFKKNFNEIWNEMNIYKWNTYWNANKNDDGSNIQKY